MIQVQISEENSTIDFLRDGVLIYSPDIERFLFSFDRKRQLAIMRDKQWFTSEVEISLREIFESDPRFQP